MKLYTEEQVKNFLKERTFMTEDAIDKLCAPLTPIELPSEHEIEVERKRYGVHGVLFSDGAKWRREQILNPNKQPMKTAMQEAIDYLREFNLEASAIILEDKFLKKEKEQIVDAVNFGNKEDHYDATEVELANYYYNQTYNQNK
jgi:hypothetical protein